MSTQAQIIATLTDVPDSEGLVELSKYVDILEVRADLARDIDPDWLRSRFSGELLFTLRSREQGGGSDASDQRRHQRLAEAADQYDLVDLEVERDLTADLLSAVSEARRVISWHGAASTPRSLKEVWDQMASTAARFYKIVPFAEQPGQELAPLALLHSLGRRDLIAFAAGSIGTWTRLLAPRLGAPVVYAAAGEVPGAPGQIPVQRLVEDFGLPTLHPVSELCGLVGRGVDASLSPRLHNHFYRQLGLPYLYLPFEVEAFGDFWLEVIETGSLAELGFRLRGLSVTSPHKRIASAVAGASSPLVDWLGTANTLVCRGEVWEAESTDGVGVTLPLQSRRESLDGCRAAVIGAGGAGRAAVAALRGRGADVTLVNRSVERGRKAAAELRVPFRSLDGFDPADCEIVVHATPLGRQADDPLPLDPARLPGRAVVIDLVYLRHAPTRLVQEVRHAGREAIDGREVLVAQALPQFAMMTGHEFPLDEARRLVGL